MKQVLFILLIFISFQGFSQESVKIQEIGLEVMKEDLGKMTWYQAVISCENLNGDRNGYGWRLPSVSELQKIYYQKDKIGGFKSDLYWSSTGADNEYFAWYVNFYDGLSNHHLVGKGNEINVRAVRPLK